MSMQGRCHMQIIFAEQLRELMNEQGLNQVKLAERVGVKQNTVSAWLLKKKEPSLTSLWLVADYFGVETDYLIGRKSD